MNCRYKHFDMAKYLEKRILLQTDEKTCTYIDSQRQCMVTHSDYKPHVCSVTNHAHRLDICKSIKNFHIGAAETETCAKKHTAHADTMHQCNACKL